MSTTTISSGWRWVMHWVQAFAEARADMLEWRRTRSDGRRSAPVGGSAAESSSQGWGRFPEQLPQDRDGRWHLKHL